MNEKRLRFLGVFARTHDFTHFAGTYGVHTASGDTVTVVSLTAGAGTHNVPLDREFAKPQEEQAPTIVSEGQDAYVALKEIEGRGVTRGSGPVWRNGRPSPRLS